MMPGDISPSENVGDTGDRAANWVGVGERSTRLENDTGEPRSTPDIADGGRFTAMPNESPTGRVLSMSGESGSAGERRERDCEASDVGDRDRSIPAFGTSCESVVLVALPLRTWPDDEGANADADADIDWLPLRERAREAGRSCHSSLKLTELPLRLWPEPLPASCREDLCGLAGAFHVTFDGVLGRDGTETAIG